MGNISFNVEIIILSKCTWIYSILDWDMLSHIILALNSGMSSKCKVQCLKLIFNDNVPFMHNISSCDIFE